MGGAGTWEGPGIGAEGMVYILKFSQKRPFKEEVSKLTCSTNLNW
jgi:hypothetical protein